MKSIFAVGICLLGVLPFVSAQETETKDASIPVWTETDRKFLLDNLIRTKEELIAATKDLSEAQWNFKENPDRWSINQIVEHVAIWELLLMREISVALSQEPIPSFTHFLPDSLFLNPDPGGLKGLKLNAMDYTKPFSFAVPLGNNKGQDNITWLMTMRNESIDYIKSETRNIRLHYICFGPNVHQNYMMIFRHNDRHLVQIRKVKAHPNYPK